MKGNNRSNNWVFVRLSGYEKTIMTVIGIVIIGIIAFSAGVERGKRLSVAVRARETPPVPVSEVKKTVVTVPAPLVAAPREAVKQPQKSAPPLKFLEKQGYVIQLASFKNRSLADKEAKELKKLGFSPVILPKGNYSILCVGNIGDKQAATTLLSQLRKRYTDCYIRRL